MIKYHLEVIKDYKKPRENKSYDYKSVLNQQNATLYADARIRTFDILVDDSLDLENQVFFVSEFRKEPCEVHVSDRKMQTAECSCSNYFSNEIGNCMHIEVLRRLYLENDDLRGKFSRRQRETPILIYDSLSKELVPLGNWDKSLFKEMGFEDKNISKFAAWVKENPKLISSQVRGAYIQKVNRTQKKDEHEAWANGIEPAGYVRKELYPFQEVGTTHLIRGKRVILADDMGLGKTIQTICAAEVLKVYDKIKKVLVVCPASVKHNWQMEIRQCTGSSSFILQNAKDIAKLPERDVSYVIGSYELIQRNIQAIKKLGFDLLVIDEAQRLRNFETKTWQAIKQIRTEYFFVLSGTLIENKLSDLFSIMELIDKDVLGPRWKFEATYMRTVNDRFAGYHKMNELRAKIAPYVLRRQKKDVLKDLPPMTEVTIYCPLTKEQKDMEEGYRETAQRLMAQAGFRELSFAEKQILNQCLLKARQACDAAKLCKPEFEQTSSPKLEEFARIIEDICRDSTQKVLVFSEWIEMLRLASGKLDELEIKYCLFNGSVAVNKRAAIIDEFLNSPTQQVFLSTDAGGVGLNLQAASNVIHLDIPWNPARLDQRNGRIHRINQKNNCYVTYLVSEFGIERGIEGVLKTKRGIRAASLNEESDIDEVQFESFSAALSKALAGA